MGASRKLTAIQADIEAIAAFGAVDLPRRVTFGERTALR